MMRMIGFEFGKILHRKIVYAAILMVAVLGIAMYAGRGPQSQIARKDGVYVEGTQAIAYNRQVAEKYRGELTEERVKEILEEYAPGTEDGGFWIINDAYNTMVRFFGDSAGRYLSGGCPLPDYRDDRPLVWDYNRGYIDFMLNGLYMMMFLGFLLIVALSPVFSEEYTRGTDALILTARHGKRQCAWAKIAASYLFTLLITGILLGLLLLGYLTGFGLGGGEASVQLNSQHFMTEVPYFLSCIQAAGYCLALWVSGALILTGLTLLLSAVCRSSFISIIAALFCYLLPSLLGQTGVPIQILGITPFWCFMSEQVIAVPRLFAGNGAGFSYVWVIALFGIFATGVSFSLGRRIFARHQVG